MKVCTCFLLIRIFACTISSPLHSPKGHKRDINIDLNLKGAVEFNVVKNSVTVSDKKLTGYNEISRRDSRPPRVETFTGFIQEVIKVLFTYDDNTFEDFFQILDKEIRNFYYTGSKFNELVEDYEIRNLIAYKFDFTKEKSIRDLLEKIKDKVNNKNVKRLLSYINSIYKEGAREEFREVLTDLMAYRSSNNTEPNYDLAKIIRNGIRAVFFNHFINLDAKEKRGLKQEIIVFLNGLTENPSASSTEIVKTSDPTSTTVQNKVKNKRRQIHRKQSRVDLSANKEKILTTSEEESDRQQLALTFVSTEETYYESNESYSRETSADDSSDETVYKSSLGLSQEAHRKFNVQPYDTLYIEDFYKNSEKPQINMNKSEMKSKLAEGRSIETSTDRLPTARPNTYRFRHKTTAHAASKKTKKVIYRIAKPSQTTLRFVSVDENGSLRDKDFRRSVAPHMPNEELSVKEFDRERKKVEEALAKSYSFVSKNRIQHGLKDYIIRRRHLDKTINELKQEYNQLSTIKVTTYNGDRETNTMNDFETNKTQQHNNKPINHTNNRTGDENIKDAKAFSERQSSKYVLRPQTDKSEKARNTDNAGDELNLFSKNDHYLEKKKKTVKSHNKNLNKLKKQKKVKRSRSKKATKKENTTDTMKTAKEKNNLTETTSKATTEVYSVTLNVNKEVMVSNNATAVNMDGDTRRKLTLDIIPSPRWRRRFRYKIPTVCCDKK